MNLLQRVSFFWVLFIVLINPSSYAAPQKIDGMYVNSFGKPQNPAVIFVHGGPGYNSYDFEMTTAQALADEGFFVVVYDQRGQGRSDETAIANFNYQQYAYDLKTIIDNFGLKKPILLGHSHGGPISLKFDEFYPGMSKSIILVAAPINFWGSLHSLISNCSVRYASTDQNENLDSLTFAYYQIALNPAASADEKTQAVGMAFAHGLGCGLYRTKNPSPSETALRDALKKNPLAGRLSGLTTAMPGFLTNENYIMLNQVDHVIVNRSHIFGIYGDEDGLFSPLELSVIKSSLQQPGEPSRFHLISGASHGIYIDQQSEFLKAFKNFAK